MVVAPSRGDMEPRGGRAAFAAAARYGNRDAVARSLAGGSARRGHAPTDPREKGYRMAVPGRDQRGLHQYRESDAGMPAYFSAGQTLRRNDVEGSRHRPVGNLDPLRGHRSR